MAANSNLTFNLFGRDVSASKAFKGVEKSGTGVLTSIGRMGTAFAGLGTAAVVAGTAIAIDFGKQSIDAFTEAQAKSEAFDYAMGKFKGLAAYKTQLDDLSQALALKTKFDDDETKAAIATLARYNLTGKQLEALTPLVQDYAAATGRDLTDASVLVGKAMLGNARALKELGITFKPTGDKAKDFARITDLLRSKVGGFAEREGKSAAGTSEILANQFNEVKEKVGSYLVPALTSLGQMIIQNVIPAIQVAVSWLSEHLGPVVTAIGTWVMQVVVPALRTMADAFMKNVWPAIKQVWAMVASNLQPAFQTLGKFWNDDIMPLLRASVPAFVAVAKVVGVVVAAILILVSWLIGKLAPAIAWIGDKFYKVGIAIASYVDPIVEAWRSAFNAIADAWNNTIGGLSVHIPGIPGTDIGNYDVTIPKIPHLANGGIVTRPTLALIGEAGPEAVVPLSRGGGMGGGPTIIVQTLPGNEMETARAISRIMRNGRLNGIAF